MTIGFEARAARLSDRRRELLEILRQRRAAGSVASAGNPGAGRSPLVTLKAGGARPRLLCPHAVSGSPYWYLGLSRAVHPDQPMDGFEAPGLHGEEDPIEDLATLAARYVAAVRERYPDGSYLLAGWSMGGFLAFEMARQLAATGIEPPLVAMIDSGVPGPFPAPDERTVMQTFAVDLAGLTGREPPHVPATIASLDAGARLSRLAELLISAGLVPSDVPADFIRHRYAVFRANMLAIYGYQPAVYSGRVVMLQAEQEASREGWRRYAAGGYTHLVVPGTHYTMWVPENLPVLARALDRCVSDWSSREVS